MHRIDIHWQVLLVEVIHNESTLATIKVGIEVVLATREQPREVCARHRELLEARHCPTEQLVIISLRDYGNLVSIDTEEALLANIATCQDIARDNASMLIRQLATKNRLNRSTCHYAIVLRLCHARTCNCNYAREINLTCEEQTTENYDILNIQGPNLLALVDWVDVVNLNAYIARRVLTLECVQLYTLNLWLLTTSVVREMYLTIGQTAQYIKSLLQRLLLISKSKVIVGCERCAVECRHKESLWFVAR